MAECCGKQAKESVQRQFGDSTLYNFGKWKWGGMTPMITNLPERYLSEDWFIEILRNHIMATEERTIIHLPKKYEGKKLKIRKLTPRECFRVMDVDEPYIDKMIIMENGKQALSNCALYKLAGNSIVVICMAFIFCNLFEVKE